MEHRTDICDGQTPATLFPNDGKEEWKSVLEPNHKASNHTKHLDIVQSKTILNSKQSTDHSHMENDFSCKNCSFTSSQKSKIRNHIKKMHGNVTWLSCAECKFKTSKKRALHSHIRNTHAAGKR